MHAQIIDEQLDQLRASARLHEVFTELAVAGAAPVRCSGRRRGWRAGR